MASEVNTADAGVDAADEELDEPAPGSAPEHPDSPSAATTVAALKAAAKYLETGKASSSGQPAAWNCCTSDMAEARDSFQPPWLTKVMF